MAQEGESGRPPASAGGVSGVAEDQDAVTIINPQAPRSGAARPVPAAPQPPAGADEDRAADRAALAAGYLLKEYRIERVLGVGGFGVSYLAHDTHLNIKVAIKEYLPSACAYRDDATGQVRPKSSGAAQDYRTGLDRFVQEARTLAAFRHPNIVGVNRFFEANNSAYMVMDYEFGESLNSWMSKRTARGEGAPEEAALVRMFVPLLQGVQKVHEAGFLHRDIKPANIFVRDADGSLVLLDFGSARLASGAASAEGLTSIVTPGYAPFEQYHTHGRQGPWSDIYALGGVLYWFVAGRKPIEAAARVRADPQEPAALEARGRYSERFLQAIDWALLPDDKARPQSIGQFLPALTGEQAVLARQGGRGPSPGGARHDRRRWAGVALGIAAVLAGAALYAWLPRGAAGPALRMAVQTGAVAQSSNETREWLASLESFNQAAATALGRPVEAVQVKDYAAELARGAPAHDLYLAPLDKIGAPVRDLKLTPLARFRNFAVVFLVKAGSGIEKLSDLEGRSLAAYPADSSHGPIMMHWLLINEVRTGRISLRLSNSPEEMVDALFFGKADAVAIPQYGAEEALARYGSKLKVLSRSEAYPGFVLAVAPRLSRERAAALQQALLGLHKTPEGAQVLQAVRLRQAAGTVELAPIQATEVVAAAQRLERARKLYPPEAPPLETRKGP